MGLRFRKSVTLCKGVKLNFGKTGMSVSVGGKGYHKTINTKGQVTTSMGIPGTGIYYTDTKKIGGNKQSSSRNNTSISNYGQSDFIESQEEYTINSTVEEYLNPTERTTQIEEEPSEVLHNYEEDTKDIEESNMSVSLDDIKKLYLKSDEVIDWTELLVSASADDVFMEPETWKFLKSISRKILSGDIDAYMETIEKMRPVDDLLDYGSDFEFGTDNPNSMEVEFRINEHIMLPNANVIGVESYEQIFKEYVCASSIRVARDLFALLPVKYVIVYAKKEDEVVLQARFDRNEVQKINFKEESGVEIIERFILND